MTGKLPENVAYFARALRGAGLRVGPGAVVEAVEALADGALGGRDDVYWALHAIFVKKHEDTALYDQAFRLFWRRRNLIEKIMAQMSGSFKRYTESGKFTAEVILPILPAGDPDGSS